MLRNRHKCIVCRVEAMLAVLDHFDIQFARAGLGRAMDLARPSQWSPPMVPNPSCTRSTHAKSPKRRSCFWNTVQGPPAVFMSQ